MTDSKLLSCTRFLVSITVLLAGCANEDGANDDKTAPVVVAVSPAQGAVNVELSPVIFASFSEELDPASINSETFTLTSDDVPVSTEVNYNAKIARMNLTSSLSSGTEYFLTVSTAVKDLAGNNLISDEQWSFTTEVSSNLFDADGFDSARFDVARFK